MNSELMTDKQIIRKAVELADGWIIRPHNVELVIESLVGYAGTWRDQELRDALAAQLVRQVDDTSYCEIDIFRPCTGVQYKKEYTRAYGTDRTMNTLRAIVKSGVLER